jgi:hypothetical protein
MKKIFLSSLMLLSMAIVFTACEDDRDSNPTLTQPSTFTLNKSVNNNVDLANSSVIPFTWSQPDYGGWPAAVDYQFELSPTNDWSVSVAEANADETGTKVPTYDVIKSIFAGCSGELNAEDIAKAIVLIERWDEESVIPEEMTIWLRLSASTPGAETIYSNPVSITVKPYFISASAVYDIWYMVGNCIGSQEWSNGSVGIGLIPMYPAYDTDGTFLAGGMYVGYFPEGGQFKFVHVAGSWDEQLNYTNVVNPGDFLSDEDGDNHNIGIKEAGYYMIMVSIDGDVTIEKYEDAVTVYDMISLPGDYQEWAPENNALAAVSTLAGAENHDWFVEETFAADAELKFAANGGWDVNWGGTTFPYGLGVDRGDNIKVPAGKYYIMFNDIMGTYTFIAAE